MVKVSKIIDAQFAGRLVTFKPLAQTLKRYAGFGYTPTGKTSDYPGIDVFEMRKTV